LGTPKSHFLQEPDLHEHLTVAALQTSRAALVFQATWETARRPDLVRHAKCGILVAVTAGSIKPVVWLGDSLRALRTFPSGVQDEVGYALYLAQRGDKHMSAKPLKGLGPGVLEIVSDHRGDTYRAVYTVRLGARLFVLHAFQKKSKHGIAMSMRDLDLIKRRLRLAVELSEARE
jgi:phage-related protein